MSTDRHNSHQNTHQNSNQTADQSHLNQFNVALKGWRKHSKMSQLDLALAADVSQRHVSWLETGRSQPSREMVLRLADAMEVPLRDRNQILNLAGFASLYTEYDLNEPIMEPISSILTDMLEHHQPYPAFVLDRYWNIKMKNTAADSLFTLFGDPAQIWQAIGDDGSHNIALLTLHPQGLRSFISNSNEVTLQFMRRLKKEALESRDPEMMTRYQMLEKCADLPDNLTNTNIVDTMNLVPLLPLEFSVAQQTLKLCSVISTFGTAQDITANELRIETFYPADDATRQFFSQAKM